jgi:arylsulfatase A-like enzyme
MANKTILVLWDDVGDAEYKRNGVSPSAQENTPNLSKLCTSENSAYFQNMLASPVCSPTRINIQTGRNCIQTGFGTVVTRPSSEDPAPDFENTETGLASLLAARSVTTGMAGKWHLRDGDAASTHWKQGITKAGYQAFGAVEQNLGAGDPGNESYYDFTWSTPGADTNIDNGTYLTTYNTDQAISWINARGENEDWFLYVPYNSAHSPFHVPESGTYTEDLTGKNPTDHPRAHYYAMLQSLDFQFQRLWDAANKYGDCNLIWMGDNGSPSTMILNPYDSNHAKGTVFLGGCRVPCLIHGPAVSAHRWITHPCHVTDIFKTVLDLHEIPTSDYSGLTLDSVSLIPYLTDPSTALRSEVYVDNFQPNNGTAAFNAAGKTKLECGLYRWPYYCVRIAGGSNQFFQLDQDPYQGNNLDEPTDVKGTSLQAVYDDMIADIIARYPS